MRLKQFWTVVTVCAFLASCTHQPVAVNPVNPENMNREPQGLLDTKEEGYPWTDWSEKGPLMGLLELKSFREDLLKKNLHDPHVSYVGQKSVDCAKADSRFRSADGTCYSKEKPHEGAAGTAFGRNIPPEMIDFNSEKNLMNPDPGLVSKELFTREGFKPVPFLNMLAAVWIQFMNHDWLTHGVNDSRGKIGARNSDGTAVQIDRTQVNQKIASGQYDPRFGGKVTLNDVTHWWDGSQIYGSSQADQSALRTGSQGLMKTDIVNGREVLPKKANFDARNNRQNQGQELSGFTDNWWIGLNMLHTLFVKEHNAIAKKLYDTYVVPGQSPNVFQWVENKGDKKQKVVKVLTAQGLDQEIFQIARLVNSALLAKIHTVEWTPAILPNPTLIRAMCANWYGLGNKECRSGVLGNLPGKTEKFGRHVGGVLAGGIVGSKKVLNAGVPFSITEEFTSVYRLHSLLPESLVIKTLNNSAPVENIPFVETRNHYSYDIAVNHDLKDLYYSFGTQLPGQLVLNNFPQFMQKLEVPGHNVMDIGMLDVLRDRERGVPRYNQFRRAIGLKPIRTYSDFFHNDGNMDSKELSRRQGVVEKFKKVYGVTADGKDNVEAIDLLAGTLAEEVRPKNYGFGETMFHIFILMASRRLMADPYFTTHYNAKSYTQAGIEWVDNNTFGSVITRHMPELKDKIAGLPTAFSPWNQ